MRKPRKKTREKIDEVVDAYGRSMGIVSTTCKKCNINRKTFYEWKEKDKDFAERLAEIDEAQIDFTESQLLKLIKGGDTTATIFYLKTKGKQRGYVERQEITGKDGEELVKSFPRLSADDLRKAEDLNERL